MTTDTTRQSFAKRYALHIAVGSFILVSSFLYGISAGLAKHSGRAFAGSQNILDFDSEAPLRRLVLPRGVEAAPLGREIQINGKDAEVVSFVSDRSAIELVNEQAAIWRAAGLKVIGTGGARRGFAVGVNENLTERYSFSAWTVPPALRGSMSAGKAVQGMMAIGDVGGNKTGEEGLIPEVPLRPGGMAGAVFSSLDPGGRSYSGVYSLPGSIGENIEYYRSELAASGWNEMNANLDRTERSAFEVGNVLFRRRGEEVVMLFSPSREGDKTVVSVTRGPLRSGNGAL